MFDASTAGRQIAAESLKDDILTEFDRGIVGGTVQLRIPIRDSVEIVRCMDLLTLTADRVRVVLNSRDLTERNKQFLAASILRDARDKLHSVKKLGRL